MKHLITNLVASAMLMLGCSMVSAQGNVTVDRVTHKVLFPSDFFFANEVTTNAYTLKVQADLAAHNVSNNADFARQDATNVMHDSQIANLTQTNAAQDEAIDSKVSTSEMGDGLTYSNGQWIVTSQGTVTNIDVNGKQASVSNGVAAILIDAEDIGAWSTNTPVELWTNVTGILPVSNATVQDASLWSTNPAIASPDIAGYTLNNVGGLSLMILTDTNAAAAPALNNVWTIYAVSVKGTNYLMGVDYLTNRTWIGSAP